MKDKKEKWEKEWLKRFKGSSCRVCPKESIDFISDLLKSQKSELKKKVEGMKLPVSKADEALAKGVAKSGIYRVFNNSVLNKVIKLLEE